jgi:hypothetical protein
MVKLRFGFLMLLSRLFVTRASEKVGKNLASGLKMEV